MTFVSYAQNMEDVMLWRALKDVDQGFYIDVGANDPDIDSVTKAFYEQGWRGINLEPVSQWFERLHSERPRDINLQIAAGAEQGELQFYEIVDTGLSTTDKAIAEKHEAEHNNKTIKRTVPVNTLTEVCKTYHCSPIHFLKIDVEGYEKQVLEGIDFSEIRPWIIVVESTLPSTQIEDYEDWDPILLYADYEFVYFDGLNRYYIASEHQNLKKNFDIPPNVFDGYVFSGKGSSSFQIQQARNKAESQLLRQEQNELKQQFEKLTSELALTQASNESLTAELEAKSESLVRNENTLNEKKTHIQSLHSQSEANNVRREQLAAELALTQASNESLTAELEAKSESLVRNENTLNEKKTHIQSLHSQSEANNVRREQLAAELALTQASNESLTAELEAKSESLLGSEKTLTKLQAHCQWLENECNAAKAKVEELNRSSHHWWSVADGLSHDVQRIYRSKSWRLTWPLRKFVQLFKWMFSLPAILIIWLTRLPKRVTHCIAARAIRYVLKRPGIKARVLNKLSTRPALKTKLRQFAIASSMVSATHYRQAESLATTVEELEQKPKPESFVAEVLVSDKDLSQLTPRALTTYKELILALSKQQ